MATQVQNRRGTTAEHSTFTGAVGEVTIDTDKDTAVVHDGATAGGRPLLREDGSNSALALGSAATPSLKFTGDTNTGIYSPGADQLALSTNGTGRLFVDASGRVSVGNATPSSIFVVSEGGNENVEFGTGNASVNGGFIQYINRNTGSVRPDLNYYLATGGGAHKFYTDATERLRITSAGLVGVGTSSPNSTLHVAGSLTVNDRIFLQRASGSLNLAIANYWDGSTNPLNGTKGDIVAIGNAGGDGVAFVNANTERMRLTSTGLGIGTSSPLTLLHSNSTGTGNTEVVFLGTAPSITSGQSAVIRLGKSAATSNETVNFEYRYDTTTSNLSLHHFGDSYGSTLNVVKGGRVGIGTTSPSELLTIADGNLHISDTVTTSSTREIRFARSGTRYAYIGCEIGSSAGGAPHQLTFGTNTAGATPLERARIDSSGRLLVGTSSARAQFLVTPQFEVEGTTSSTSSVGLISNQNTNAGPYLFFGKTRGTAVGGVAAVQLDDVLGGIYFQGANGTNLNNCGASIESYVDAEPFTSGDTTDLPSRLVFSTTADGASSPTERMRIGSSGIVSVGFGISLTDRGSTKGISMPDWRVYNSTSNQYAIDNYSVGVKLDNGATAWSTVSDERQKTNLQPIENGLNKVSALRAVTGRYLVDAEDISRAFLIAQDVQAVLPEAVSVDSDKDSTLGLRYTEVIPLLVAALKESKERIETLEAEVAALKAQ